MGKEIDGVIPVINSTVIIKVWIFFNFKINAIHNFNEEAKMFVSQFIDVHIRMLGSEYF